MKSAIRALQITLEELNRNLKGRGAASPAALLIRISIHEVESAIQVLTAYDEEQQAAQAKDTNEADGAQALFEGSFADWQPPEEKQIEERVLEATSVAEAIRICKEGPRAGASPMPGVPDAYGERQLSPPAGEVEA